MNDQGLLPNMPECGTPSPALPTRPEAARVVRPMRHQIEWAPRDLDAVLPEGHRARAIWGLLERLDLSAFYAAIKAVVDGPGRPASDPRVLLALWLLATVDGVGSARRLARLCEEHDAYRWLRGGVPINYHQLSDFRMANQQALDDLLTELVATLLAAGLVSLDRVAQDGLRIRASAGASSFRREARLEQYLEAARAQVERLAQERDHPDPGVTARERAARERAARERQVRVEQALQHLPAVQGAKERQRQRLAKVKRGEVSEARVSSTDPEARVMKMADGGFRPAFNAEVAADMDSQVIVGVGVTNQGTDEGQALPLERQVVERVGRHPGAYVVDGSFAKLEDIVTLERQGVTVYAPIRPPRTVTSGREATMPRATDPPEVAAWRARMGTEEGKAVYRQRGATAEWVNAQVCERYGLRQFRVRGLERVLSVLLLMAIAHNLLRWIALTT